MTKESKYRTTIKERRAKWKNNGMRDVSFNRMLKFNRTPSSIPKSTLVQYQLFFLFVQPGNNGYQDEP